MQRRREVQRHTRVSSAVENGHSQQQQQQQQQLNGGGHNMCLEGTAFTNGGGGGGGANCLRKSTRLGGAAHTVRLRLRQAVRAGRRKSVVGMAAYLFVGLGLLLCGLQISGLAKGRDGRAATATVTVGEGAERRQLAATARAGDGGVNRSSDVGPRLAYGIMVYQRKGYSPQTTLDQFGRMLKALYDEENTYVIHVDIKSDKALLDAISYHIKDLPNVPSVSVSWGGITVVERTLALMTKAVEVDSSWRFFVNLGHEDYPSASQAEMRRWLKDRKDGTNFIKCWPIEGHDFFGQMERHEQRVQDVNVDDFMGGVKEYRTMSGNTGSQERPKTDYKFFKSLQQTMLSRQLTEYAIHSSEARRLLLYMATSKAPDELYFPTLTQLDERYSSMATCNDTRHFSYWIRPGGSWHPEYLTLDHFPLVYNATEFYIRKVEDARGSKPLLDTLDILRAGHPLDAALPILKAWLNRKGEDGVSLGAEGGPIMPFPEDGTVDEAMAELYRRQSEYAESRRCMFLAGIARRSRKRAEAGAAAAAISKGKPGPKDSGKSKRKRPFAVGPGAAAAGAGAGGSTYDAAAAAAAASSAASSAAGAGGNTAGAGGSTAGAGGNTAGAGGHTAGAGGHTAGAGGGGGDGSTAGAAAASAGGRASDGAPDAGGGGGGGGERRGRDAGSASPAAARSTAGVASL
ncbi:unnamed protein product [Ectocarpus sp. 12 AP-2014]